MYSHGTAFASPLSWAAAIRRVGLLRLDGEDLRYVPVMEQEAKLSALSRIAVTG